MTDVADLVVWWRGALDDAERTARAATPGPWHVDDESYAETIYSADGTPIVAGGRWGGEASVFTETADAIHIAANDPAAVLASVAADRALLDLHDESYLPNGIPTGMCTSCENEAWPCPTIRIRAAAYAHHPGYREEWAP